MKVINIVEIYLNDLEHALALIFILDTCSYTKSIILKDICNNIFHNNFVYFNFV